jgi:hypothetical protein
MLLVDVAWAMIASGWDVAAYCPVSSLYDTMVHLTHFVHYYIDLENVAVMDMLLACIHYPIAPA